MGTRIFRDGGESVRKKCIKCEQEIVEHPFYKLRDSGGVAEVYLCAPRVREWMHSWLDRPVKNVPEQPKLTEVKA